MKELVYGGKIKLMMIELKSISQSLLEEGDLQKISANLLVDELKKIHIIIELLEQHKERLQKRLAAHVGETK